jgi:hypothetical protein
LDKADFAARRVGMIGEPRFKKYAVFVPLIRTADGSALLFEKRAGSLRRQPGEICFVARPGHSVEQLAQLLGQSGAEVLAISTVRDSLEDVFLQLMEVNP